MHYFGAGNLKTNTLIMKKEKIKMEYMLKGGSENIIWSIISTPSGLETWFADKVIAKEKTFTFQWGKDVDSRISHSFSFHPPVGRTGRLYSGIHEKCHSG